MLNAAARLEVLKVLYAMGPAANRNDVMLALVGIERNDLFPEVRKGRGRCA